MNISENAFMLIELIENEGYEAFAVGGCVRDSLMGKSVNDVDITTSAGPFDIEKILDKNNIRYIETGLKHGTITAVVDNEPFEITTYRTDGEYKDNRHPDNVNFVTDISMDLSRRDFTVNAMAYNKSVGIVDLLSGKQDLDNKIIRAVGDADTRFKEDALRIMRAIRFASVLSFKIDADTKKAIFSNKELLRSVSAERLFSELSKLLLGDNAFDVMLEYREVLAVIIPELVPMFDCEQINPWHIYDVWTHTCKAVVSCSKNLKLRLTMLLHDIGKPAMKTTDENGINHFKGHQSVSADISSVILKRLKVSNEIYDFVMTLIPIHDITVNTERKNIKKWLNKLGVDKSGNYYLEYLLEVKKADKLAQNLEKTFHEIEKLDIISSEINSIIEQNEPLSVKDLAINGFDLMSLNIKGREIGTVLKQLLEMVIDNKIDNKKQALLDYVKRIFSN